MPAQYVGVVLSFCKSVFIFAVGQGLALLMKAVLLDCFAGLIWLSVIKNKTTQTNTPPQHLTIPRLCGFFLCVLSAYWAGEGDDDKYYRLVSESCWVRSLTAASEALLEIFWTVITTSLV